MISSCNYVWVTARRFVVKCSNDIRAGSSSDKNVVNNPLFRRRLIVHYCCSSFESEQTRPMIT